jgi:hypothetical protein
LNQEEIIQFLKNNIEPLENSFYGNGYRASVYLNDGTFLPCVTFRNSNPIVDLAVRRFKEESSGKSIFKKSSGLGYRDIVKTFVASGNCINHYDISKITDSKFAFPVNIQKEIRGETAMSWTAFVAKFNDGRLLSFGTSWNIEYFDLPEGYKTKNIIEIINNSYIGNNGEIVSHKSLNPERRFEDLKPINREKPFFECYMDNL